MKDILMALCRCLEKHPWPEGRTNKQGIKKEYIAYVKPAGYPKTALICGIKSCIWPGVLWLENHEKEAYKSGERIFKGPSNFAKMKADDSGIYGV